MSFNRLGFSTFKTTGQLSNFLRWCNGGNFETRCHQNISVTTSMLADNAVTAEKADPNDIVLIEQNQSIIGNKKFTSDIVAESDVIVSGEIVAAGDMISASDVMAGNRVYDGYGMLMPPGTILTFAGQTAPNGFLVCNGVSVSRTTYADLFAVIGTIYGTGDGSTTFNLPDLSGKVTTGVDGTAIRPNVGSTGGVNEVTLTNDQLPSHTHTGTTTANGTHTHSSNATGGQGNLGLVYADGNSTVTDTDSTIGELNVWTTPYALAISENGSHVHTFTTNATGNGQAFSVLNPFMAVLYIIKV